MPAAPATIEQLARDVALSPDAENALRALNALRAELDMLEPELVRRALHTGASWSQIARALGISKQAAHKKHRRVATGAATIATTGAAPKILVTSEARRCIQAARDEARRLGQAAVGTEHILLGILRCEHTHAVRALNALGITLDAARAGLQPTIVGIPREPGPAEKPAGDGITPHARRILEGSLREAVKRQEGYIGVEHLLLALLADSRNGATQTLEYLRTTPTQIRRQLEREWAAVAARAPAGAENPGAEAPAKAGAPVGTERAEAEAPAKAGAPVGIEDAQSEALPAGRRA